MTSPVSSSVSVPRPRRSFTNPAKLKDLQDHLEKCVNAAPDKPVTILDHTNKPVTLPPHVATAVFAAEEFFERAKTINPQVLDPIYGIQAMERVLEKGIGETSQLNTNNMLLQAAATGSDQLFALPLEHGVKPPDKPTTRQIFKNVQEYLSGALQNAAKAREQQAPDLPNQADWEKWMTALRIRHRNSSKRMEGVLRIYDNVHYFVDALKSKISAKKLLAELATEEKEKLSSAPQSKSAKKKARQKAAKTQQNLALPIEAESSASQAPERTETGKGKFRRTAARKRSQRTIAETTDRQQVLQSASLPVASGSSSVATRSVPEPANAFATLTTLPEDRVEILAPTSPIGHAESTAIISSADRETAPLPGFDVAEARAFLQNRWDAAMEAAQDRNSNVKIYQG